MYGGAPEEFLRDVVRLTTMRDCLEALRLDKLHQEQFAPEAPFREGTIIKLDGPEHLKRRRILNRLVRKEAHARWRQDVLLPTIRQELAAVLDRRGPDGIARVDLVPFSMGFFNVMACALTGLDLPTGEDRVLMLQLIEPLNNGDALRWAHDIEGLVAEGLVAKDVFRDRFFRPSLERRRQLLKNAQSDELAEGELPMDMMMLVALQADPAWSDEDNAVRNVMQFMIGASHTNVHPLGYAIDELESWFEEHPEDYELRIEPRFLEGAVNEAMRLHTIGPTLWRVAAEDLIISSGVSIRAGQTIAVEIGEASVDPAAYGPDAATFNPHRKVSGGVYPYGLRKRCAHVPRTSDRDRRGRNRRHPGSCAEGVLRGWGSPRQGLADKKARRLSRLLYVVPDRVRPGASTGRSRRRRFALGRKPFRRSWPNAIWWLPSTTSRLGA
jgi:cytochrome P450